MNDLKLGLVDIEGPAFNGTYKFHFECGCIANYNARQIPGFAYACDEHYNWSQIHAALKSAKLVVKRLTNELLTRHPAYKGLERSDTPRYENESRREMQNDSSRFRDEPSVRDIVRRPAGSSFLRKPTLFDNKGY
jgi:hypothetical protein